MPNQKEHFDTSAPDAYAIRIESLFQNLNANLIATVVVSGLLAFYLYGLEPTNNTWYWFFTMTCITSCRIPLLSLYDKTTGQLKDTRYAARAFAIGAFFAGAGWGSAFYIYPAEIFSATAYIAILVACVMALTCNAYQASSLAVNAFISPVIAIVFFRFVGNGETRLIAISALIYGGLLAINAERAARKIAKTINLQISNQALVEDLAHEKEVTEALNKSLELKVKQRTDSLHQLNDDLRNEIEQKKLAEKTLAESEARFRALYHEHPSILLTIDSSGFVTNVNDYGASYLGYSPCALQRMKFSELSASSNQVQTLLDDVISGGHATQNRCRLQLVKSSGDMITTQATARKMVNFDGNDRILIVCEDVTEIDSLQQQLAYHASRDTLTALYNRREFELRINQLFEHTKRHGGRHALCCFDLDRFKHINDSNGHGAGDKILKAIAETMTKCMRQTDVLARLGGDEFGIIMEKTSLNEAEVIIERLRDAIAKIAVDFEGEILTTSASIGITEITSAVASVDAMMKAADSACYAAKSSGRNCVRTHILQQPAMIEGGQTQRWAAKLTEALETGKLSLALQAVVDRKSAQVCQYEALLRILDAKGNHIRAEEFIDAASRKDLTAQLDRWTFDKALALLCGGKYLKKDQQLSINVSSASLHDPEFRNAVTTGLEKSSNDAARLSFEFQEREFLRFGEVEKRFLEQIKRHGANIIIDDFGSNFAALQQLEKLPVNAVKIAPQLISSLEDNSYSRELFDSLIRICRATGTLTIAKGIETERLNLLMKDTEVEQLQGYSIAEPFNAVAESVNSLRAVS